MFIKIQYQGRTYLAIVIDDYKVKIDFEELGEIELTQCRECGEWCSEDDELYGDGYCDNCSAYCEKCDSYYKKSDMAQMADNMCIDCLRKWLFQPTKVVQSKTNRPDEPFHIE